MLSDPPSDPEPRAAGDPAGHGLRAWLVAAGLLAILAFRDLLSFQPERALPEELEQWFFVPSESISPLVLLLAGWLVFRRSARLRALPRAGGSLGVGSALLLAAGLVHAWATLTEANDLLPAALMLAACGVAWLWRGAAALRVVALPVAFLGFAMAMPAPLRNELLFRLQLATAQLAGTFLYLLGIPHFVAGEQIQRTEQLFSVIESCSGLRSIEILTMVAILMADLFRRGGVHAWLLTLAAPFIAFGLNGVRALLLILNPHSEVAAIHNLQGVAILLAGLVVLFVLDGLLERLAPPRRAVPRTPAAPPPRAPQRLAGPLATLAFAGMALVGFVVPAWPEKPAPLALGEFTAGLGLARELEIDRQFLGSTGFREAVLRSVAAGRQDAVVFVGVGERAQRTRSALSPKSGLPGSGWVSEAESVLELDGRRVRVRVMRAGSRRWLVHHWYEGSAGLWSEALRSWLALDRSPWRSSGEIVAVRVDVPLAGALEDSRPRADAEFLSFFQMLRPLLSRLEDRLAGKKFSAFSGSRKRFSASRGVRIQVNPLHSDDLGAQDRSARDLLFTGAGATGAPRGSIADLRSLG